MKVRIGTSSDCDIALIKAKNLFLLPSLELDLMLISEWLRMWPWIYRAFKTLHLDFKVYIAADRLKRDVGILQIYCQINVGFDH